MLLTPKGRLGAGVSGEVTPRSRAAWMTLSRPIRSEICTATELLDWATASRKVIGPR